ncbi:MAG: hypothetical protein NTU53_16825 [Planctomycetota bacterium]|nr:hypothetical protein [Planctomycetota bacterium]
MSVEELGVGGPGSGVVVNTRPLDFRAIAFGGRIVDGEEPTGLVGKVVPEQEKQSRGQRLGFASHGGDEVAIVGEVAGDSRPPAANW